MRELLERVGRRVLGRPAPSPERLALKSLKRSLRGRPANAAGSATVGGYRLRYTDPQKLLSQWHELFIQHTLRFAATAAEPRMLDCGGNMGLASLYFKRLYPAARVTAFEADAAISEMCRDNLAANGHGDVEVVHAAAWVEAGAVSFCSEGRDSGTLSQLVYEGLTGTPQTVPAVRLRDYLEREPIDLLKLDIEGAEFDVLADCAPALGNVARLVVELHETDPARRRTAEALDTLSRAGFRFTMDGLYPMHWRGRPLGEGDAFPGKPAAWVVMVYAWRA